MDATVAFISMPGGGEWIIIGMIGLLLFGKRLPEVGSSLGKMIVEFKKGLRGIEDDIERATREANSTPSQPTLSPPTVDEPETSAEQDTHEIPEPDVEASEHQTHM